MDVCTGPGQVALPGRTPAGRAAAISSSDGGDRLLLDCGSGVFGKLRAVVDYATVDAVVISHLHADHILDLVPFASGLIYAPRHQPVPVDGHPGTDDPPRPRLLAPPGARDAFRRLCAAGGMSEEHIESGVRARGVRPRRRRSGSATLEVRFQPGAALPPDPGRVASPATASRITYSADSSPSDALCAFARDTDLLLIEATLPRPEREGPRGHLTPAEAGEHGRRAGARRLVLTHISDELDADWARREAERSFGGPVEVAAEGAVYRSE